MDMLTILEAVRTFDGALVVIPEPGSEHPELSWGDAYFYYALEGTMPERTQPYGTIITKDYPDDTGSELDAADRFRVNVNAGRALVAELPADVDPAASDELMRHPLYGSAGWVSVVNPSDRTAERVLLLLRQAHDAARSRAERRTRA